MRLNHRCLYPYRQKAAAGLNMANTDALLRANELSVVLNDQAIARIDVSQLAANKPVEDYFSAAKCLYSNAHLFGVFDGHGGAACSRHVSTRLFDYLCGAVLEKHKLMSSTLVEPLEWLFSSASERILANSNENHVRNVKKFHHRFNANCKMMTVRRAMQEACVALDVDLADEAMPDSNGQVSRMDVEVVASGSCALVAHVRHNHLHVANVGDSEAVLGVHHLSGGGIISRLLSRPHSSDNYDEINRVRSNHPVSEASTVLQGSRLLGELFPLRAFGDVRFKWPRELQKVVLGPLGLSTPAHLNTPPYLTAMPEVLYHQLTPNDRFLVLATDGLWEWLDADTVVRLISDHTLGAQTLSPFLPTTGQTLKEIRDELNKRRLGGTKKPLDENSATHIIRNALGGCSGGSETQYARLQKSLQLPPGMARHFRDDITVIVIHFNEEYLSSNFNNLPDYEISG